MWVAEDDRAFASRLARYCARNPVALERLTYDRAARAADTETVTRANSWRGCWCTSLRRATSRRGPRGVWDYATYSVDRD